MPLVRVISVIFLVILRIDYICLAEKETKNHEDIANDTVYEESEENLQQSTSKKSKIRSMREEWKSTFKEIKALVVDFSSPTVNSTFTRRTKTSNIFNEWKLLLDGDKDSSGMLTESSSKLEIEVDESDASNTNSERQESTKGSNQMLRQRFDGFATWESRLEQWGEDVSEYLASMEGGNYPMSTFGRHLLEETSDANSTSIKTQSVSRVDRGNESGESHYGKVDVSPQRDKTQPQFKPRPIISGEEVVPETDISDKTKKIWIVTTAALPWMTGTAVNALLRAAYLSEGRAEVGGAVTLMLPWLERVSHRKEIYGEKEYFETPKDQETHIRTWLKEEANMEEASKELRITWYMGRHEKMENSIYSMGDIVKLIPEEQAQICVLEEPEHLNWYRAPGESWTNKFKHVVGIVHTNYFVYAQEQPGALIRAPAMRLLCSWMCRAHCHRIIKLSGTLDSFAPEKELVENVHGVRQAFLDYGTQLSKILKSPMGKNHPVFGSDATPTVYFIGKMLWSKGIGSLMELLKYAEESADLKVQVDMYGGGPNLEEAKTKAQNLDLSMPFHGPIDHAYLAPSHKILVNPSVSEVLCTTVAEALAMGKFVVVPSHPSNDFFAQFPNCLTYANKEEFIGNLYYALTHSPEPLSDEYSYVLSWQAACKRFEAAGSVSREEAEALAEATEMEETAIEIDLPPIIENEKQREKISNTVKKTRARYRTFRSNLSQEFQQSNVLPKELRDVVIKELDKRLDLDVDKLLSSPTLKLQLSPAELDRLLLDFYNTVVDGPSGDVFRWIANGSATCATQYLYLRNQEIKARRRKDKVLRARKKFSHGKIVKPSSINTPQFLEDVGPGRGQTATKWIRKVLKRNLQQDTRNPFIDIKRKPLSSSDDVTRMSLMTTLDRSWPQKRTQYNFKSLSRPMPLRRQLKMSAPHLRHFVTTLI